MAGWSRDSKIAATGVAVAAIAVIVSVVVPEIRRAVWLDGSPTAEASRAASAAMQVAQASAPVPAAVASVPPHPVPVSYTTPGINKNDKYVQPPVPAGDKGHLLAVDLTAEGQITDVDYHCAGNACGFVHECPNGGYCNGAQKLALRGNSATWYGWSNSGDNVVLTFTVHYIRMVP